MCLGLATGYIKEQPLSLLKQDETEKIKFEICDRICKYEDRGFLTIEDVGAICKECVVNKITKVEVEEWKD